MVVAEKERKEVDIAKKAAFLTAGALATLAVEEMARGNLQNAIQLLQYSFIPGIVFFPYMMSKAEKIREKEKLKEVI
jgi:uncharacterized membrane-anchored protein